VRGDGVKTGFSAIGGGEQWNLDMLGNWDERITDTSTLWGVFDGSDTNQPREHNGVNELTAIDPSGDNFGLEYDDAGNLRQQDKTSNTARRYTHDAWNRLVKVELVVTPGGSEVVLDYGAYEYNGLHQRTIRRADTDLNGALDQQRFMYYDASWRLCEEEIWDDWDSEEDETDIDRHIHYTWGPRYIDDIAFRRVDNDGDGGYIDAGDEIYYHLTDAQFSTKTVIDSTATIVEWVEYTPYGVARHHHKYDMDNDRDFDSDDRDVVQDLAGVPYSVPPDPTDIDEAGYRAEADINRDGTIDTDDYNIVNGASDATAIGVGLISTDDVDNIVGYDGYLFNAETRQYHVRFRVYDPGLGRWIERDPLRYVDYMNLFGFLTSSPVVYVDPSGLQSSNGQTLPSDDPIQQPSAINDLQKALRDKCHEFKDKECSDNECTYDKCLEEADRIDDIYYKVIQYVKQRASTQARDLQCWELAQEIEKRFKQPWGPQGEHEMECWHYREFGDEGNRHVWAVIGLCSDTNKKGEVNPGFWLDPWSKLPAGWTVPINWGPGAVRSPKYSPAKWRGDPNDPGNIAPGPFYLPPEIPGMPAPQPANIQPIGTTPCTENGQPWSAGCNDGGRPLPAKGGY